MVEKCTSCKMEISVSGHHVVLKCPNCGEAQINRCDTCRKRVIKYKCPKCGFEGP
ncbi:Uncharacterised protein [Candidatus Tiddalikarchaeum anstoanum]|nr:Uncharacterised protein [Candidatus Tiddalikarchaeum anstoanum]